VHSAFDQLKRFGNTIGLNDLQDLLIQFEQVPGLWKMTGIDECIKEPLIRHCQLQLENPKDSQYDSLWFALEALCLGYIPGNPFEYYG
jgi:hypothetical protein